MCRLFLNSYFRIWPRSLIPHTARLTVGAMWFSSLPRLRGIKCEALWLVSEAKITHVLVKLSKSLAYSILHKNQSFPVRVALNCGLKTLVHGTREQRMGGEAVDITGCQGWEAGWAIHMNATEKEGWRECVYKRCSETSEWETNTYDGCKKWVCKLRLPFVS